MSLSLDLKNFIAQRANKIGINEEVLETVYVLYKKYAISSGDTYAVIRLLGIVLKPRSFRYIIKCIKERDKELR